MTAPAIRVTNVGKRFRLGRREPYLRISELPARLARGAAGWFRRGDDDGSAFWALRDVSFEVQRGEVVGIIGRNGAGKSTLLKVLSRITRPTEGEVQLRGRVGSLLEVGTGFHPELTGRENVYLNGTILGMRKAEIDRKFDEIVAFSEIEQSLDTPVKHYSSGMYMRLAFSVAAYLEPEILVVDEVLAVGDAQFQKKCLGKMKDVALGGRTVLFVSHNMGAIRGLCSRAVLLHGGRAVADGNAEAVVRRYLERTAHEQQTFTKNSEHLELRRVLLKNAAGEPATCFLPGDPLTVEVHYFAPRRITKPHFWIGIDSQHGSLFAANMLMDGAAPESVEGEGTIACTFRSLPLLPQPFVVWFGLRDASGVEPLIPSQEVAEFQVTGDLRSSELKGELAGVLSWASAPVVLPYTWRLPGGTEVPVPGLCRGCKYHELAR